MPVLLLIVAALLAGTALGVSVAAPPPPEPACMPLIRPCDPLP